MLQKCCYTELGAGTGAGQDWKGSTTLVLMLIKLTLNQPVRPNKCRCVTLSIDVNNVDVNQPVGSNSCRCVTLSVDINNVDVKPACEA